jgi:acyl-CoA thioesterase-1
VSLPSFHRTIGRGFFGLAIALAVSLAGAAGAMAAPKRLVVLGDSLSAGYQLPADAAFPSVLERALKAKGLDVRVVNAAVSGDTASAGLERFDWALGDGADAVIVGLGANDMLRGIDPAVTEKALSAILSRLNQRNIPVLLAGMYAAPGMGAAYEQRFNGVFPQLAKRHDAILYPFLLEGVAQVARLNLNDGMHPNRQGVEEIVRRILPSVEKLLQRAAGS